MSKLCSNCNAEIPDEAEFCPKCGSTQIKKIICESCGHEIEGDVKFCPKCGNEIDPSLATVAKKVIIKDLKIRAVILGAVAVFFVIALLVKAISGLFTSSEKPVFENSGDFSFTDYSIGDTLCFGTYEQDNNLENGPEEIEWIVLDKDEDGIFVISKYCLDCMPYHNYWEYTPWENSIVRNWLNLEFIKSFNDEELEMIRVSELVEDTTFFEVESTNTTHDKIYILSASEAEKYIVPATGSDYQEEAHPTAYAIANGAVTTDYYGNGFWWLRTTAEDDFGYGVFQTFVTQYGWIDTFGTDIYGYVTDYYSEEEIENPNGLGVRPVMWIDTNKPSDDNSSSVSSSEKNLSNESSSIESPEGNKDYYDETQTDNSLYVDTSYTEEQLLNTYRLTYDEAAFLGGLYWKYDDNTFINLCNEFDKQMSTCLLIDTESNYINPLFSTESPVTLVYFSDYSLDPNTFIFSIHPVIKTGYTTNIYNIYGEFYNGDHHMNSLIHNLTINQIPASEVLKDMLDIHGLYEYSINYSGEPNEPFYIFDASKNDKFVIGYYEGTYYKETFEIAKYEYLLFDLSSEYQFYLRDFELTQNGYAELTLDFEPGFYFMNTNFYRDIEGSIIVAR